MGEITVNDSPIVVDTNQNNHYRGLHIVIISSFTGKIVYASIFDTYKTSNRLESFIDQVYSVFPKGYIVVAACMDDCVTSLSDKAKDWFISLGSEEITKLKYR